FESLLVLWRAKDIQEIPSHLWKENFEGIEEEDRIRLLQQINWDTYLNYTDNKRESSQVIIENYFEHFISSLKEKINFCCFDLETHLRTKKIDELAWRSNEIFFEEIDTSPDDILQLKNSLENADLVIGHNIRNFDLEKLYGEEVPDLVIWDSLEI